MRAWSVGVVAGIVCAALGYVVGTRVAEGPAAAPAPVSSGDPPSRAPAIRGLVCAATQRPDAGAPEDCDAIDLRARWCEGELAEARRERAAVRETWPEATPSEAPERWTEAVEEALETCALGADLELVDCTEYPCTAALRPAVPPPTPEAFEQEMERLMELARGCGPLREAFGVDETNVTGAIDVYRLDARCDGEREDFFVLAALDPEGPAYRMLNMQDRTDQEDRDFNRWLYRRADDLSAMWPCR